MVCMTGQMRLLSCMALAADGRPQLLAFLAAIGGIPVSPPRRGFVSSHTWATWMVSSRLQSITRLLLPQSCCEQQRYESRAQYWNRSQCLTGLSLSIALFPLPTCLLTVTAGYPGFSDGHPRIVTSVYPVSDDGSRDSQKCEWGRGNSGDYLEPTTSRYSEQCSGQAVYSVLELAVIYRLRSLDSQDSTVKSQPRVDLSIDQARPHDDAQLALSSAIPGQ